MQIILISILCVAVGATCGYLAARLKSVALQTLAQTREQECASLRADLATERSKTAVAQSEKEQAIAAQSALQRETELLKTHFEQSEKQRAEHFAAQLEVVKGQLQAAAQEIMDKRVKTLNENNSTSIDAILKPYKENMEQMRNSIKDARDTSIQTSASLEKAIEEMMKRAETMGSEADKLAKALKNDSKMQGNWGEMVLDTLLIKSGLTEGEHYERQSLMRDQNGRAILNDQTGKRMITDVVIHYPDGKDLIIDSKVSLSAFTDYCNADDEVAKADALKRHVASVKSHIKELTTKDYSSYITKPRHSVGYMLMFVPNDSAMQLALMNDKTLWQEAFEKGVFITSEQNLLLVLRLIQNAWTQEHQYQNQQQVYKIAAMVLDRIAAFKETFEDVGSRLTAAQQSFVKASDKMRDGKQSIVGAAQQLIDLGAKSKKMSKIEQPDYAEIEEQSVESAS